MLKDGFSTKISVLNTSIASMNVGDFIIMDSAYDVVCELFPKSQKIHFPSHERLTRVGFKRQREVSANFLCGTNCLNSKMFLGRQWNIGFLNTLFMKHVVTVGVGWRHYEHNPDLYSRQLLSSILDKEMIHSVRDSYTEMMLKKCGVKNIINTSCPTMWKLTPEHCSKIRARKSRNVVFTLTDYTKNKGSDSELVRILKENYSSVYFWVQGSKDYEYYMSFGDMINGIKVVAPNLNDFDMLLVESDEIDYVGTRLHAGIRALQKGRRSIIIGVDNRAEEKRKDFNLMVVSRENIQSELCDRINQSIEMNIKVPFDKVNKWKSQFM